MHEIVVENSDKDTNVPESIVHSRIISEYPEIFML